MFSIKWPDDRKRVSPRSSHSTALLQRQSCSTTASSCPQHETTAAGERTNFLARAANGVVVLVKHDADFVHEPYLLFIIAGEVIMLVMSAMRPPETGIHFWDDADDVAGVKGVGLGDGRADCCGCCAHCAKRFEGLSKEQ